MNTFKESEVYTMNKTVLQMEKVSSCEYYENLQEPGLPFTPVLKNINFTADKGELWSVFGSPVFEIKLLLEIMANARAYETGRMLISGVDTLDKKRTILPSVFYIGSTNMAFGNMNVLEYLMFITGRSARKAVSRQEYLLNYLTDAGLGYICLTPISMLSPEEKSILILAAASLSGSALIIMNLPRLEYDSRQISSICKLALKLQHFEKTFIFNTRSFELAQSVSTHFCYINKGTIIYRNSLRNFLNEYDRVIYSLSADNIEHVAQMLRLALPQFEYSVENDSVLVIDNKGCKQPETIFFNTLGSLDLNPRYVYKNKKSIKYAIQGLMRQHDLQ